MSNLHEKSFRNSNLKFLEISWNSLISIEPKILNGLESLEMLNISKNQLESIHHDTFKGNFFVLAILDLFDKFFQFLEGFKRNHKVNRLLIILNRSL